MKKYMYPIVIFFSLFLMAVSASGADEAIEFPTAWSLELQATTRSVIQAGLDQEDAMLMTRSMIQSRFEERQIVQAQHIVAGALEKELPVEPVMNKAYEGMAKQVPAASIVRAMERVTSRYEHAYALAGQLSQQKETVDRLGRNMAAGLAAGMTPEDMEQLVNRLQIRERHMHMERAQLQTLASECLLTARDMVRQGVSSGTTAEVVSRAVEKGFGAEEIQSMRRSFMSQGAQGSAESLAKSYSSAIAAGKDPQESAGKAEAGSGVGGPGKTGSGDNSSGGDSAGSDGNGDAGESDGGSGSGDSGDSGSGDDSGSSGSGGSGGSGSGGDSGSSASGGSGGSGDSGSGGGSGSGGSGGGSGR